MFSNATTSTPAVPSRNALRVLRQLAFAGSVGTFCTVAAITYDVHRRIRVAEQIIENKRTLRTSAPNYDATASAKRLAVMMEAAEAGEFMGLESLKHKHLSQSQGEVPGLNLDQIIPEHEHESGMSHPQPYSIHNPPPLNINSRPQSNIPFTYVDPRSNHQNRVAMDREYEEDEARRVEGKPSTEESIQRLLKQARVIDAANLFLKATTHAKDEAISWSRRALGYQIFTANCKAGNVFIARSIYRRIELVSVVDTQLWSSMITVLAKEGHIESAATIYEKYRDTFTLTEHLLEVVIRLLMESNRLSQAKWLFYTRISNDRNGGLCGIYLDGLWKRTRNVDLVNAEFRKVLAELNQLGRKPTSKVFNALVKAYIEAGQYEDAEAVVGDMHQKFDVQPGCRTLGLLVHCRALQCDWTGVLDGMREMHDLGFTNDKPNFNRAFDRVWLEYWPVHSGTEVWKFLEVCIREFKIRPDEVLHRHMLEGLVERCDSDVIQQFNTLADKCKWKSGVDHDTMMRILAERRAAMQDSPTGLWNMMQAAKKQYRMVAMSRRIMGVGAEYYRIEKNSTSPIQYEAKKSFHQSMSDLQQKSSINLYIPIIQRMEHYIHVGKYLEVEELLEQAVGKGYPVKPLQIELGVIASLLRRGASAVRPSKLLIKKHWLSWNNDLYTDANSVHRNHRFAPIFFQQVMQLEHNRVSDSTVVKLALFRFYEICAENERLNFKHHASAAVARRMISMRRPFVAISLLSAIYMSKWRKIYGFNQVQLKMLLRAFTHVGNARGIWWCMMTVLSRNEPVSRDFVVEAERLVPYMEQGYSASSLETLQTILTALQEKHGGSKYWSQFVADPELKKASRNRSSVSPISADGPGVYKQELPTGPLEAEIIEFDEEMQFDYLSCRQQLSRPQLVEAWNERAVIRDASKVPEHPQYPQPIGSSEGQSKGGARKTNSEEPSEEEQMHSHTQRSKRRHEKPAVKKTSSRSEEWTEVQA
ncbi:hypothetical protein N7540_011557 [Penicillium herquei]|nr:hypothetical protein N7540_011557 [Penicillium herquei]